MKTTATHAQIRFTRRLLNKQLGTSNPDFGQPIPGALSEVEKAHKARRRERRKVIVKDRLENLRSNLKDAEESVKRWDKFSQSPNAPEAEKKHAAAMLNQARAMVAFTSSSITRAENQLQAVTA